MDRQEPDLSPWAADSSGMGPVEVVLAASSRARALVIRKLGPGVVPSLASAVWKELNSSFGPKEAI
jgi:hypothetical protein